MRGENPKFIDNYNWDCFVEVWNLFIYIQGGTQAEGVWE